jgi:tRNA/rRNA methyltransferase
MNAPLSRIRIVLSRTSHPGNIGAAARAMKTMGLSRLYLVSPKHLPEEQAVAMASGADDVLAAATVVGSLEEALQGTVLAVAMTARRRDLSAPIAWIREAAAEIVALVKQGENGTHLPEVALVFGNETAGLSNQETDLCQRLAMIPANVDYSSLNLAAAVQVAAYELRVAGLEIGAPPSINETGLPASHEEVEGLMGHIEAAAIKSGFLYPTQPKRLMPRLRRLFARARPEQEEVAILRGLLSALMDTRYWPK